MKTQLSSAALSLGMLALAACATLGPTPSSTGISAVPAPHPGAELGVGFMPGYYLSQTVTEEPHADAIPQASALLDVGELIGVPGLFVAGRVVGESGDTQVEPLLGYRRVVGAERQFAVGGIVHATHASTTADRASYEVTRGGVELVGDARLNDSRWVELHAFGTAAVGVLSAAGSYCTDGNRTYGVDCPEPPDPPGSRLDADVTGVYPSGSVGLAIDVLRRDDSAFHGARLGGSIGGGLMPQVVGGEDEGPHAYFAIGLGLTIGFGAAN